MRSNLRRALVLAMSGALVLAACGSDSDDVSSGAAEELPSDASDAPAATDASSETTAAGSGSGGSVDGDFCAAIADSMGKVNDVNAAGSDAVGLAEAFSRFGEVADAFADLQADAPEEIRDDVETLANAFDEFRPFVPEMQALAEKIEAAAGDPAKLQEAMLEASAIFRDLDLTAFTEDVQQAGENVSRYVSEECGIDVGS